jgi:hypothetical protein
MLRAFICATVYACFNAGPLCNDSKADPRFKVAALLTAFVHDLKHPGLTNAFLKATSHPLTREYGTESTSEKMHAKLFRDLIDTSSMNFLEPLGEPGRSCVINWVQEGILSSDMATHGSFLGCAVPENPADLLVYKLQFAMKIADLSHCLRPFRVHNVVVNMLKSEFYEQGDKEKSLGVAVSFGMNRDESDADVAAGQADFLEGVILPLLNRYLAFCGAPLVSKLVTVLKRNIESWRVLAQSGESWSIPLYSDQKVDPRMRLPNTSRTLQERMRSISDMADVYSMACDSNLVAKVVHDSDRRSLDQLDSHMRISLSPSSQSPRASSHPRRISSSNPR